MRSKDTKTTLFMYSAYECSAVEEYLEKMANKGWLLQSARRSRFKFKKIEKTKIKYSVDVLDRVSVWEHENSDIALEYREYCEAAGWKYVCEDSKIQIFYTQEDKEISSIHTDKEEKYKVIFKASKSSVYSKMILIVLYIVMMYMTLISNAENTLATNLGAFMMVLIISVIFINIIEIISFYMWVIKARGQLKKNDLMPHTSLKQLERKNILIKIYNLTILIILIISVVFDIREGSKFNIPMLLVGLVFIIIINNIKRFTDKKDYSKDSNMGIYIGVTIVLVIIVAGLSTIFVTNTSINMNQSAMLSDRIKLTFGDFGYKKSEEKESYIELDKSLLANRTKYFCGNAYNSLEYTIFESKYPWLIKLQENSVVNRYKKYMSFKQERTKLPSNIKVYVGPSSDFIILVSEDKVIFIVKKLSVSLDEFLDIAYKKFFAQ